MRKLTKQEVHERITLQNAKHFILGTSHYLCDDILDFKEQKETITRPLINQIVYFEEEFDFSHLYFRNVRVIGLNERISDEKKEELKELSGEGTYCSISDETGELKAVWGEPPQASIGYKEAMLVYGFNSGQQIDLLSTLYHIGTQTLRIIDIDFVSAQKRRRKREEPKRISLRDLLWNPT